MPTLVQVRHMILLLISHLGGNDKLSLEMLDKSARGCRDEGVLKLRVNFEKRNESQVIPFLEVEFYMMI